MLSLEISVLKTITYFDVFSYPLTVEEILFFLDCPATKYEVANTVDQLIVAGQLWQLGEFYSIRNDFSIVQRRICGNRLAIKYIKRARTVAKFLSWFPFVRGIAISGSLSKNFADKDVDLDFFVIAKANRLWVLRMLLAALFKIAYVSGLKKWFCINYIIDESGFIIEEKNIFTAVEISTLMPLKGKIIFNDFFKANNWVYEYLPNYVPNYAYMKHAFSNPAKQLFEWVINAADGDKLDERCMHFFKKRYERLYRKHIVIEKGFIIGSYVVAKHNYKPMPQYFQPKGSFLEEFFVLVNGYLEVVVMKAGFFMLVILSRRLG